MIKWFSCSSHQSVYIYCKIFISWSFDRYSRSLFGSELGRRKFIQSVQKLRSFQVKTKEITAWKGFFSGPYFPIFGMNNYLRWKPPYLIRIQENTDQKKLRIWILFTQWTWEDIFFIATAYRLSGLQLC